MGQYLPSKKSIHAERLPSAVGLYTSPHLRFVRERIKINNEPISEELFARRFWEVWDRLEASEVQGATSSQRGIGGKPVYFHFLTLVALHCYMQEEVGTAVIECGIGGEFDTTNVFNRPSVTGVTSLGIDHEALLGSTIDQIAWHKAGIFKEGVPAFSVPQPDKAMAVLQDRAKERKTKLNIVPMHAALDHIKLGLNGDFQKLNASLAIAISAAHLQQLGFTGVPDPLDPAADLPPAFATGLEMTRLGGRCDLRVDSRQSQLTWYIDGGHTLESIEMAGRWFASHITKARKESAVRVLVFNQQTRDASTLARRLYDTLSAATTDGRPFTHAIFCPNTTYRNAGYKPDLVSINTSKSDVDSLRVQRELASTWGTIEPNTEVHVVNTIEDAVNMVREIAGSSKTEVLVTGSLHLVGGCIEVLEAEVEAGH